MSTNYYIVDIFKEAKYNKLMKEIKNLESKYPNTTIDVQYEQYKYHICKKSAGYRAMFQCVADIYNEYKSIDNLEDLEEFYYQRRKAHSFRCGSDNFLYGKFRLI